MAAFTAMVAPPPPSEDMVAAGQVTDEPRSLTAGWTLPELSAGAPRGAVALAGTPTRITGPQAVAPEVTTGLAANGIPHVALNAYRVAAARMASAKPTCGIDWSLLAGIGRVESNHGRYGGAVLGPDGSATPKILGPALDGVKFAYIGDSDGGRYDGDTTYDRAMGPMQFIPTTWRSYAIDADGNTVTDPFNINDAALAAANYLCVAGGDLRTDAGQRKAVLAYNHSDEYVAQVLALARAYAAGIPVADLPLIGVTSGPVPGPSAFAGVPAAPGPAIGMRDMTASPPDQTVGQSAQPAAAAPAPGGGPAGGSAPPVSSDSGTATRPGAPSDSAQPPPRTQPAQPAQPAPAPEPPAPLPSVAVPPAPLPVPLPPAPAAATPTTLEPVPGVTCTLLGPLRQPLRPDLPVCPTG
ncbi:MAG: Membrane-bound lytic murein transglycosylase [Blastococcus sp.]|nr:Membrane-bound lytic murein transglycosylase [Blastococcus sp.]